MRGRHVTDSILILQRAKRVAFVLFVNQIIVVYLFKRLSSLKLDLIGVSSVLGCTALGWCNNGSPSSNTITIYETISCKSSIPPNWARSYIFAI